VGQVIPDEMELIAVYDDADLVVEDYEGTRL
jgi:hypothetical protein